MFEDVERFAVKTGIGRSRISRINALDEAMVDACVGDLNLIKVTSILPGGIERIDEIPDRFGTFRPAVLSSVKGSGPDQELVAGLAWGWREDKEGGYVIEHSSKADEIDMKHYREKLEKKLDRMAETREIKLMKKEIAYDRMELDEDMFGCVIAALVYLP